MLLAVVVANGDPPFRKVTGPAVRLEAQLEELALFLFFDQFFTIICLVNMCV